MMEQAEQNLRLRDAVEALDKEKDRLVAGMLAASCIIM